MKIRDGISVEVFQYVQVQAGERMKVLRATGSHEGYQAVFMLPQSILQQQPHCSLRKTYLDFAAVGHELQARVLIAPSPGVLPDGVLLRHG